MLRILTLLLALCLTLPALAGPFEDGEAAFQRGDYATALRFFRLLEGKQHPRAPFYLAFTVFNNVQAVALIRKSAEQGDAWAQFHLGWMYESGLGLLAQDYRQAMFWYRKSAEQGDTIAQLWLGHRYRDGSGVPQDYEQAIAWYRKSAEQGVAEAQFHLGRMYADGKGVRQDYVQAHKWFNLAASSETNPDLRSTRVTMRDALAAKMTREQIAKAQQLAREWKPKGQ